MRVEAVLGLAPVRVFLVPVLLTMALVACEAGAHALAPSLLSLAATGEREYEVTWKTPLKRVDGGRLQPVLPDDCSPLTGVSTSAQGTAMRQQWTVSCGDTGLTGKTIRVTGIEASKADVLLRVRLPGEGSIQQILTPRSPDFTVPAEQSWQGVFGQYLGQGFVHLIAGLDHVLFVVALTLVVGINRSLVWTVTSFTLGHSVTLSAAVLGFVSFPQHLAEILIALTILMTFAGVLNRASDAFIRRRGPELGFVFGLLHGLGFAGALRELGLPPGDIPLALLAFNLGVEVGQLLLVALLLVLMFLMSSRPFGVVGKLGWMPVYAAGSLGGFWFWQRLLSVL